MIISDIDYLEQVSETSTLHLSGGKAIAISSFWALAFGPSTYTSAVVNNQVVVSPNTSFASSSVQVTAASSGSSVSAIASSSATVFN
jgi:hypothetical protein